MTCSPGSPKAQRRRPGVFVSYRRSDSAGEAGRLADHLAHAFGQECVFFDVTTIRAGQDWRQQLDAAMDACDTMLVVIGKSWLDGSTGSRRIDDPKDMVAWEITRALNRGLRALATVLIVGYDAGSRKFRCVGPWGTSWGQAGYANIDLDTARRVLDPESLWSVALATETVAELRSRAIARPAPGAKRT